METLTILARASSDNATAARNYRNQCTLDTCPITDGYFYYRPSLAANAVFLALFSLSTLAFVIQVGLSRRFIGFSIAMISGCILEMLGYIGRIQGYKNPFGQNPFLIQIVCLTIAPSFLAAGLYLTLSRIVTTFGPQNSRIAPLSYPRIFIPCDIVSLLLQAGGGGIASTATHQNKSPNLGDHILVAGLAFQVLSLGIFICISFDFALRTITRMRKLGQDALDPTHARLRSSRKFKLFLIALSLATLLIFIRSTYRVVELGEGWTGQLIRDQGTFIGLEGAMVIIAVLSLNVFHPGLCFREGYQIPFRKIKGGKKGQENAQAEVVVPETGREMEKGSPRDGSQDEEISPMT